MNNRLKTFGILCVALLPATASALQPLITDDTGTQGTGGNQLEASYYRTTDKVAGTKTVGHEVPLVYTRGITDALDLYVSAAHQRIVPEAPDVSVRGWGNTVLGGKWRFYEEESRKLSLALRPEVAFPVSDGREAQGLGTARTSYSLGLLLTKETSFGAMLANLIVDRTNYADDVLNAAERRSAYRLSVAPVWDIAENWKVAFDTGVMTNPDRAEKGRMGYVELGAIYSPGKDLDLAFGLIRNLSDGPVSTLQATMGITWRFR